MIKQEYKYHHIGLPTTISQKNDEYNEEWKFYGLHYSNHQDNPYGIQWMKYDENCKLPSIVQEFSHVAFQVNDLEAAIRDKQVIIEPYSPSKGVLVAFIEENGVPIKFLQIDKIN